MGKLKTLVLALPCLFLLAGCAEQGMVETVQGALTDRRAFQEAKAADNSQSWQAFISQYPNSSHAQEATEKLNAAYWREAQAQDTAAGYLAFITAHANHPQAQEARERAGKLLLEGKGEQDDYLRYLSSFPDDRHNPELRLALQKLRLESARKSDDIDKIALFLAQYPGAEGTTPLKSKVEAADYQKANALGTRLAWQWFLKNHPKSPHGDTAGARLQETAPKYYPADNDLDEETGKLRQGSPVFRNMECRSALTAALAREKDLFGAKAESLRAGLAATFRSTNAAPAACSGLSLRVAPGNKTAMTRLLGALGELAGQRKALAALMGDPDELASKAAALSQTSSAFADDAEGKEQEEEALYNRGSENPDDPKDTAAENAREASRRARAAAKTADAVGGRASLAKLVQRMDAQAELLLKIVAATEQEPARRSDD